MEVLLLKRVANSVAKAVICYNEQFLVLQQCFQMLFVADLSKCNSMLEIESRNNIMWIIESIYRLLGDVVQVGVIQLSILSDWSEWFVIRQAFPQSYAHTKMPFNANLNL